MTLDEEQQMMLTARMQARLAASAYMGPAGVRLLASNVGARFRWYEAANVAAAVLLFDDHAHLTVVGSNDRYDWAINSHTKIRPYFNVNAHAGFIDATGWIAKEITSSGFQTLLEGRRLYIGGHSAGGAIAEMLPLYSYALSPQSIFTFGAPKWCAASGVVRYMSRPWRVRRFVMSYDPTPYMPLTIWRRMLGREAFRHTSPAIEIADDGKTSLRDEVTIAKRIGSLAVTTLACSAAIATSVVRSTKFGLESHSSTRYMRAFERATKHYE